MHSLILSFIAYVSSLIAELFYDRFGSPLRMIANINDKYPSKGLRQS
jgi:hypothetical protein